MRRKSVPSRQACSEHHGCSGLTLTCECQTKQHRSRLAYGDVAKDCCIGSNQHIVIHLGVPVAHLLAGACKDRACMTPECSRVQWKRKEKTVPFCLTEQPGIIPGCPRVWYSMMW